VLSGVSAAGGEVLGEKGGEALEHFEVGRVVVGQVILPALANKIVLDPV